MPGDYFVGERVFYTGNSFTLDDGRTATRGEGGEVMGPATNATPGLFPKDLAVMFDGSSRDIDCELSQLSRTPPPPRGEPECRTS